MNWDESEDNAPTSGYQGKTYYTHKRKMIKFTSVHFSYAIQGLIFCGMVYLLLFYAFKITENKLLVYFISINITAVIAYMYDKHIAVSNNGGMRVPEAVLHFLEFLGGSPSAVLLREFMNHKRKKIPFWTVSWMIIAIQVFVFSMFYIDSFNMTTEITRWVLLTIILLALFYFNQTKNIFEMLVSISKLVFILFIIGVFGSVLISIYNQSSIVKQITKSNKEQRYSAKVENTDKNTADNSQENIYSRASKSSTKRKKSCDNYYINANSLNLRSSASSNSTVMKKLKRNTKVCIEYTQGSWSYIENSGWVASKFLTKKLKKTQTKKKTVAKNKDRAVWHCEAKSQRATGWVERVGKQNAMNGAIRQCNIRKVTNSTCKISNCYKL